MLMTYADMHCYVSCSDCRFDRTVDVSALDRLWHHVCITWTKSGMYEVTNDGKLEGLGKRLVREQEQSIPGNIDFALSSPQQQLLYYTFCCSLTQNTHSFTSIDDQ